MPMELRKRKAPPPPAPTTSKKSTKAAKVVAETKKAKEAAKEPPAAADTSASTNGAAPAKPAVGDTIALDGFGGEVTLNDGTTTTLKALVEQSKAGVAIFTYPKASTPGCTQQVCLFRDAHPTIASAAGLAVYGLSTDSPKANTTFQTKQRLPYPLLCDPHATLIGAIGLKKAPRGTTRGVFVVDRAGRVLAAQPGGPKATLDVVLEVVKGLEAGEGPGAEEGEKKEEAVEEVKEEVAKKGEEREEKAREEGRDEPMEDASAAGAAGKEGEGAVNGAGEAKAEEEKGEGEGKE